MSRKALVVIFFVVFLSAHFLCLSQQSSDFGGYPSVQLSNGIIDVLVFLPDKDNGYYRTTRFDWSGFLAQVTYKGHTFFQNPIEPDDGLSSVIHDPLNTSSGTGTAEEFRDPLGYDTAITNEPFLKIGVGLLEKSGPKAYFFAEPYKILKSGQWSVTRGKDWILFEQTISTGFGYGYQYSKKFSLVPGKPEILVLHVLNNTGIKMIKSNTYCHNYFCFDNEYAGTNYTLRFENEIKAIDIFKDKAIISGNSFRLLKNLSGSDPVAGAVNVGTKNEFNLSNSKTGTTVFVKGNNPLSSFYIYIWRPGLCPEPMIDLNIKPGEKQEWTNQYRFRID